MKRRFTKLIPAVVAAAMLMSAVPPAYADTAKPAAAASSFYDVDSGAWYHDAVFWAADKGITAGTSETTFSPMASCTRGQIVTFLWRYMGSPKISLTNNPFKDVNSTQYYTEAAMWAKNNHITAGTSATTFSGERTIDRKEAITLLWRLEGSKEPTKDSGFRDVLPGKYYSKAVAWGVENHITNGIGDNKFGPDNPCTRAQIVKFISNTNEALLNDDIKKPDDTKKPDDEKTTDDTKKPDDGKTTDDTKKPDDGKTTDGTKNPDNGKTTDDTRKSDTGNISNTANSSDNTGKTDTGNPTHEHTWVPVTKTVHHEAIGHYEKVQAGMKTVVDEEAYDQSVDTGTAQCICNKCGWTTTDVDEMGYHVAKEGAGYRVERVYKTVHHDAVTHDEPVYAQKWVQDRAAFDESVITGYKCSDCGAAK